MAKPTYIIMRDQPVTDSYGQYVYDINNMLNQSGLNTLDPSDDLYSLRGPTANVTDNFTYVLGWSDAPECQPQSGEIPVECGAVQFETYPLWASSPLDYAPSAAVVILSSRVTIYLVDGAITENSDFTSYSSIGSFIGGLSNKFYEKSHGNNDQLNGDTDGSSFGFGGWNNSWLGDTSPWGWTNELTYPQNWMSPYNQGLWENIEGWVYPIQGFNHQNASNFLDGQSTDFTEYLLDIFNNYNSYVTGTDSKHYFYLIEENYLDWCDYDWCDFTATTRIVYRYPKTLFIDAWQNGAPITTEVMAWRIYGSGDNWYDVIAGNDECWNNVTHFGTGWTNRGDNHAGYITEAELGNTWDDAGTSRDCEGLGTWRPTLRLNITPPTIDVEELPPYQPFYNMGGKTITEVNEEEHPVFANPELGGYNIYFNDFFPGFENRPINNDLTYSDWRPISNIFIGDDYLTANYLQTYYDTDDINYLYTSAPNIVNLYFTIQDGENESQVVTEQFGLEYYQKIIDIYTSNGMDDMSVSTLLSENNRYLSQNLKFFVASWDWKESDEKFDELVFPYTNEDMIGYNFNQNTFIVQDAFDVDGSPRMLQHQYNSPGLKTIKAFVMSTVTNDGREPDFSPEEHVLILKTLTIRLYLGLDDIYIEDFADIGGPDFTFIPWPYTSPIISGLDEDSQYIKSLNTVIDNNLFSDAELIDRTFARKAVYNDELGDYLGAVDLEQTRLFLDGSYDMAKLLGIESFYENVDAGTYYTYYPYDKFEGANRWDGINNKYPEETSVGSIFINDTLDLNLLTKCLFEFNYGSADGRTVRDSSGNGNKGILIGDFKIKKEDKDIPIRRDSVMKTPNNDTQNGAL